MPVLWEVEDGFLHLGSEFQVCFGLFSFLSCTAFSSSGFRMLEEKEEPGFLTGLKIPAPWAAGKTVETVHPVRDNYKFKETVHIPGARCLYLRFDTRCSSQYDYDKVSGSPRHCVSTWLLLIFLCTGHHFSLISALGPSQETPLRQCFVAGRLRKQKSLTSV